MNALLIPSRILRITLYSAFLLSVNGCKKDDPAPIPLRETVVDIDGNTYNTIVIGNKTWMQENLRTKHFRNGEPIPVVNESVDWSTSQTSACCHYGNDTNETREYGMLYNLFAVDDTSGIAPEGWHVATENDWEEMIGFLGGADIAGGKLKEVGNSHWTSPNTGASNSSGFTALPAGIRQLDGSYWSRGEGTSYWTTEFAMMNYYSLSYDRESIFHVGFDPRQGYSVRCVKD